MQSETLAAPSPLQQVVESPGFQELAPPLQIALFLGALAFVAAALVSVTSFMRVIIVLSFVRQALSTQSIPPNQVLIGLALFLTLFIMGPTLEKVHRDAVVPYLQKEATAGQAVDAASAHLKEFMLRQTRKRDLALFLRLSEHPAIEHPRDTPMRILVPAFVISELKTAFIMGFCLFVPFLVIDLVVSTVLMSLGMMMMPPPVVSTPCKLMLFVIVDGWHLLVAALSRSFA
jgi:flagellar biosynthetic protein FliP